jgi:hypothetical protein
VFLLFGIAAIIWPYTGVVFHAANDAIGMPVPSQPDVVTAKSSRIYGIAAILFGSGLVAASLYREKE